MLSGAPSASMRRKATVTSCVPEAARLSAMTAPELYLPVPTKRREENSVPAMTRVDACIVEMVGCSVLRRHALGSSALRRLYDEHLVAIGEPASQPSGAGHDGVVDGDGHACSSGQPEFVKQLAQRRGVGYPE